MEIFAYMYEKIIEEKFCWKRIVDHFCSTAPSKDHSSSVWARSAYICMILQKSKLSRLFLDDSFLSCDKTTLSASHAYRILAFLSSYKRNCKIEINDENYWKWRDWDSEKHSLTSLLFGFLSQKSIFLLLCVINEIKIH